MINWADMAFGSEMARTTTETTLIFASTLLLYLCSRIIIDTIQCLYNTIFSFEIENA